MAQVNVRIDDELKEMAEELFDSLGMNMTTAINIFIRQAVREGGIPFEITRAGPNEKSCIWCARDADTAQKK